MRRYIAGGATMMAAVTGESFLGAARHVTVERCMLNR